MHLTLDRRKAVLHALRATLPVTFFSALLLWVDFRLHHDLKETAATLAMVPCAFGLVLTILLTAWPRRLTLVGDVVKAGSFTGRLAGPSYFEHRPGPRTLLVPTDAGLVSLIDVYSQPLEEVRTALNAMVPSTAPTRAFLSVPTCGDPETDAALRQALESGDTSRLELRNLGTTWRPSPGWVFPALAGFIAAAMLLSPYHPFHPSLLDLLPPDLVWNLALLVGVMFVLPWVFITILIPTRRYSRWAALTPSMLVVVNDSVKILPLAAVKDVIRYGNTTFIECHNGARVSFPDGGLEASLVTACGLAPDRHIPLEECARRLGCSRFKAMNTLGKLVERPFHIHRGAFERRFLRPHPPGE